ncbi:MAG TPA: transcriptional regulator [Giesbergeria sp.]|nr:transcriptional regulator [Giesbergeria sp.]HNM40320.1 transcriptional regulator [Giesbergeria sp.]HNN17398.1 transcriptional regulator [Giesbergeria sp.]
MALWRIDACKGEAGYRSSTSVYNDIRDGLWTKPVAIGQRAKAWPDYEVKAIVRARIAGQTDDEIRELVSRLHAKRVDQLATV